MILNFKSFPFRLVNGYTNETVPVGCRSITELTKVVRTRDPQTAILLEYHGEATSCSHGLHALGDHLHETVPVGCGPITELTILVLTRGPQTAVLLQHHGVGIAERERGYNRAYASG